LNISAEVTFDIDLLKTQKFISSSNEKFLNLFFKEEMDFNKYVSRVIVQDIQSFKILNGIFKRMGVSNFDKNQSEYLDLSMDSR
jgi:hypothetical protein